MNKTVKTVWRVGSSWGNSDVFPRFKENKVAFFCNDSAKIGNYQFAKPGNLLAITGFKSRRIVAIGIMRSHFHPLSEESDELITALSDYQSDNLNAITLICHTDIIAISGEISSKDYKRFYCMGKDKDINDLWDMNYNPQTEHPDYSLPEIAKWNTENSKVQIATIQRGLVWTPKQTALLWDSILRGFPIGSFLLFENNDSYELIDGQQRFNAIRLGFDTSAFLNDKGKPISEDSEDNNGPDAVLWIDLAFTPTQERHFSIFVTTKAHPWGFDSNYEALTYSDRKQAIKAFFINKINDINDTFKKQIDLGRTWPIKAICPVPLSFILTRTPEQISSIISESPLFNRWNDYHTLEKTDNLNTIYQKAKELLDRYIVSSSSFSLQDINNDLETDADCISEIFNRINRGGTDISSDDLNYSLIKAYFNIKEENDRIAKSYMPASKLAVLAFMLAYPNNDGDKMFSPPSLKSIREKSENDSSPFVSLYKNKVIDKYTSEVEEWIIGDKNSDDRTPSIIRADIAINHPELYLMLLYFSKKHSDEKESYDLISDKHQCFPSVVQIRALTLYLYWFSNDINFCTNQIEQTTKGKTGININNIAKALTRCINKINSKGVPYLIPFICYPSEQPPFNISDDFRSIKEYNYFDIWCIIFGNINMLYYAQRQYLNTTFPLFDPSYVAMWRGYNRPWDIDHIIPKAWIYNKKRGDYRDIINAWEECIGNKAAVPLDKNRSKNDTDDWTLYKDNSRTLLYNLNEGTISDRLIEKKEEAQSFANITFNRCLLIYKECYKAIQPLADSFMEKNNLDDQIRQRKCNFEAIKDELTRQGYEGKVYYYLDEYHYPVSTDLDWCRPWLVVGLVYKQYFVSLCSNCENYEFGIRRAPNDSHHLLLSDKMNSAISKFEELNLFNDNQHYRTLHTQDNPWWYSEIDLQIKDGNAKNSYEKTEDIIKVIPDKIISIIDIFKNSKNDPRLPH